jgi:hypothetical protein
MVGSRPALSIRALSAAPRHPRDTCDLGQPGRQGHIEAMGNPTDRDAASWALHAAPVLSKSKSARELRLYSGVSTRSRGWKSRKFGDMADGRMPESLNVKRWDGASRACMAWDNLKRVCRILTGKVPATETLTAEL